MKICAILSLAFATTFCFAQHARAQEEDKDRARAETFLNPKDAGRDYADQGEYKNDWGGAQVIALGDDNFRMVTFKGGLPGAGWDKKSREEISGKRQGDKIVFTGAKEYRAELADGKITIRSAAGGPWTMEKVERKSPTLGGKAPKGAVILFDGKSADAWKDGHMDGRHFLAAGCKSKQEFTNFTAHVEFLTPFKPLGRGQDRGNSGVYLQDRYEVQVLDSFGLTGEDNECGGIYKQSKPAVNMCFPPLVWQTYDIDFKAAKFDKSGKKIQDAVVTVKQNGVLIQDHLELSSHTAGNGRDEGWEGGPIFLQGHGNPVFYKNIWVVQK